MSGAEITVLSVAVAYLACSLAVGLVPRRGASGTAAGFVAGDRTLGLFLMYFITGASIFSAFAFLGGPGWAYSRGAATFYILGYGALGFVPFYFLGPRASRLGRKFGFVTQAEMVAARFEMPALAGWMAAISVIALVPYLTLQMKGAGYVLETVSGGRIPEWAGALVVYGVVLIYVWRSGVLGVGWTNTFQGLFMMALAWGLGLYLPYRLYGGVGEMFARIATERPELLQAPGLGYDGGPWTWGEYTSAVLVSIIGFSAWPHLFMKAFTARDERTLRRTVVLYPTFQIFLIPLMLIGFAGVLFPTAPDQPDQILPHVLMNMEIPALLVGVFCAGALAASMSSGDAMAHAAASIAVRDGAVTALGVDLSAETQRRIMRWVLVALMAAAYLLAVVYEGSLVALLLSSYGAVVQFMPALVATLYSRRARGGAVLGGLLAGAAVTAVFTVRPDLRPWGIHAGMYGVAINAAVIVLGSWWAPADRERNHDAFLAVACGEAPR